VKIVIKKSNQKPIIEKIQKQAQVKEESSKKKKTLSDINMPVFVMCPPIYAEFQVANNVWMEQLASENGGQVEINVDRFMYEWHLLFNALSQEGVVMTLPPVNGLQDEVFVNCFAFLPHIKEPRVCVISRFRAKGRQGEEKVAYDFLTQCGYVCYQPPEGFYWEGEACLKFLRDNIYLSTYGVRNTIEALEWIESNFDCQVIKVCEETPELYHSDCLVFPITPYDVLVAVKHTNKTELKKLENVANVIPIEDEGLLEVGIMNCVSVGYTVYCGDNDLAYQGDKELLDLEKRKREIICQIAGDLGMEVVFIPFTEALKMGGMLSCCVTRLNYADKYQMILWKEGIKTLDIENLKDLNDEEGEVF